MLTYVVSLYERAHNAHSVTYHHPVGLQPSSRTINRKNLLWHVLFFSTEHTDLHRIAIARSFFFEHGKHGSNGISIARSCFLWFLSIKAYPKPSPTEVNGTGPADIILGFLRRKIRHYSPILQIFEPKSAESVLFLWRSPTLPLSRGGDFLYG